MFYKQHFFKQRPAEIGKNQANAKQQPEAKLLLFENYLHSSSTTLSKNNRTYCILKNKQKNQVCLDSWDYTINHIENILWGILNFDFLEKGLGIVSVSHFVYDFSRKMFFMLYSISCPHFIVWLPLLCEILRRSVSIVIVW